MPRSMQKIAMRRRAPAAARSLAAAIVLFLFAPTAAMAMLIEVPAPEATGHPAAKSWQERVRELQLAPAVSPFDPGLRPGYAGTASLSLARAGNASSPRPGERPAEQIDPGLYATIDAPFGAIGSTRALGPDSETEFWTVLLVGAGLIAYQIRRKSRAGFLRVRPL
ncbi:MAG TPA: hypothetical protein VHA15_01365 [Burkholderiales bacterium]|nr:hypothetical protein [Burkholderiales bacterium]